MTATATTEVTLNLADITLDQRLQMRAVLNDEIIDEYADHLPSLPPVGIVREGEINWLWDGWQRIAAHKKQGAQEIRVTIQEGTFLDALKLAAGANHGHGLRRTNEDKERAVMALLREATWRNRSDHFLADACHVSHPFVARVRRTMGFEPGPDDQRIGSDGKERAAMGATPSSNGVLTHDEPLCVRCSRVGKVKGCPMCKELRAAAAPAKEAAPEPVKDAFGKEVPRHARSAYADPWIQFAIDTLAECEEKLRKARLADGMKKRAKHYPFIRDKDVIDGIGMAMNAMDQVREHIKTHRPAGVCPACEGARCGKCKMTGMVPREDHKKLKAAKK